jgi:RHS repeat-associated protein
LLAFPGKARLFLYQEATDMRKGFEGLSGIVASAFQEELTSGAYFIFLNKKRNRLKVLYWDADGATRKAKQRSCQGTSTSRISSRTFSSAVGMPVKIMALKELCGELQLENPWGYANRRELGSLVHYTHRFYHPGLMRWLTTDPIGFKDGLNLYRFLRNNPYCYRDPDGRYAIVVEIVIISFEALCAAISETTIGALLGTAVGVGLAVAYNDDIKDAIHLNQVGENEEEKKEPNANEQNKKPRTEPRNLGEQLALEEAKHNPGKEIPQEKLVINDPNYPTEHWAKKQYEHKALDGNKTNIHYWENRHTGETHGFKFKDRKKP